MSDGYVLVLDAGTSSVRCWAMDGQGKPVAARSAEWTYLDLPDGQAFARELDPTGVWSTVCDLLRGTVRDLGAGPGQIAAVTATSQRQGVVFLDAEGGEIYAGTNLDVRAVFEGAEIDDRMGAEVYRTTGHAPSLLFAPAKLRWFQIHSPESYARIATVLCLADWLIYRLSGELVSEPSLAGEAGLLDIHRWAWCSGLLGELGLVNNDHIPLLEAGSVAGAVSEAVSRETGVPAGTPVVVSGADSQCGLLGMGVTDPGHVGVVAGWSAPLQMVTRTPIMAPSRATWAGCFLEPDRWVLESSALDAGNSFKWLADTLVGPDGGPYEQMEALATPVPAGSEGALAFFGPARMDMSKVGMSQGGLLFPVPTTFADTGRGHLARAGMEAIAYAIRANLEQLEELSGATAAVVSVGGGMTRSALWTKILVDVLGRPVRLSPTPDVSAAGAQLCALTGIREYGSLGEAAESREGSIRIAEPDRHSAAEYAEHYQRWTRAGQGVRAISLD